MLRPSMHRLLYKGSSGLQLWEKKGFKASQNMTGGGSTPAGSLSTSDAGSAQGAAILSSETQAGFAK